MPTIEPVAEQNEPHPDVALVERVRAGDVSAYDTLVRKYERQLFRIAQHITPVSYTHLDVYKRQSTPNSTSITW